jgi:hypothetical protein
MRPYKGYIKDDPNFKQFFENAVMLLGHVFETAYCYNKITKEEFGLFRFDNDPTCGVVGKNNDWCLVGGDVLVLKTWFDNSLRLIGDLRQIHELRSVDDYKTQILLDPWSNEAAIWQLEIDKTKPTRPITLEKVKDFKDYTDKPYTEHIVW